MRTAQAVFARKEGEQSHYIRIRRPHHREGPREPELSFVEGDARSTSAPNEYSQGHACVSRNNGGRDQSLSVVSESMIAESGSPNSSVLTEESPGNQRLLCTNMCVRIKKSRTMTNRALTVTPLSCGLGSGLGCRLGCGCVLLAR